jgi:hypothetical protein
MQWNSRPRLTSRFDPRGHAGPGQPVRHGRDTAGRLCPRVPGGGGIPDGEQAVAHDGGPSTLTRNAITIGGTSFDKISDPPPAQRCAFDLIKAPIPLSLILK